MEITDLTDHWGDAHPIVPVMLGDAKLVSEFADKMLERNIYVIGFSYPVVPKGISPSILPPLTTHSFPCIASYVIST